MAGNAHLLWVDPTMNRLSFKPSKVSKWMLGWRMGEGRQKVKA